MKDFKQEGEYIQKLSIEEVIRQFGRTDTLPVKLHRSLDKHLRTNLIATDIYQSYSIAIQYMTNWFYKRFPDDFFKHKFLDASHVMDQFKHYTIREIIKNNKPSAHISVEDDTEYDRNALDLYNLGTTLYNNRARYQDAFFIDREKSLFISMALQEMKMDFTFSIRVNTKSVQDYVQQICEMAFRAGGTQKHYIEMDYPIPVELIGQLASDLGMCNGDGYFEVDKMIHYFNMHSKLMLLYKFNPATGNREFFLRIPKVYIHIRTSKINKQQGQLKNMVYTDFQIQFNCEVHMPSIKFFAYYSLTQHEHLTSYTRLDTRSFLFGLTNLCNIPNEDEHGWPWEFRHTYMADSPEEKEAIKNKQLITININNLFIGELREAIEATKQIAISPSAFINIKVFNYLKYLPATIDWNNMYLRFDEPLDSEEVHLIIYINKDYMHNTLSDIKLYEKTRMRYQNDHIGPGIEQGTKTPNL